MVSPYVCFGLVDAGADDTSGLVGTPRKFAFLTIDTVPSQIAKCEYKSLNESSSK